ncbi:MAG: T9SS type A sorting domain-containing protein [Candidatus Zixiibacteriota bacterium]|nr:MAG: T9SS type A sorting domain-containing protein [candidate division Zixibacteria bacterium]
MKLLKVVLTISAFLLAPVLVAETVPTVEFSISDLTGSADNTAFSYSGLRSIPVGSYCSLPVKTVWVQIPDGAESPQISWQVPTRRIVAVVPPEILTADIPTADDILSYEAGLATLGHSRLGKDAVMTAGLESSGGKQWLRLYIFPVTFDTDGNCYLNEAIVVGGDSQPLSPDAVVESLEPLPAVTSGETLEIASPGPVIEYVIVTSSDMAEAALALAEYRCATGLPTEVRIIDGILGAYQGRDDAEKLREYLKEFHASGGRYVLLAGDETRLPVRYAYPYSVSSPPSVAYQQICDLYFADLTGKWDLDNDNTWGEKYADQPDIIPELRVGRLPFSMPQEVTAYIDKLIAYETDPGRGNPDYLQKAFFFSSDQMRDYSEGGQHAVIASAYPEYFEIDTASGVELASGGDPNPYNLPARDVEDVLNTGFGLVNIIAHGGSSVFEVRTSSYNEWPKSYFTTDTSLTGHGLVARLSPNGRTSLYYSLACDNGAYDKDQPPFNESNPNIVEVLLGLDEAGAVAFVANSRWGWVGSSYILQTDFFDALFSHPERPAVDALYETKVTNGMYTDQVYGLNYFGDPALHVYTYAPERIDVEAARDETTLTVSVRSGTLPVSGCRVLLSLDGQVLDETFTNGEGLALISRELTVGTEYTVVASKTGYTVGLIGYTPTVITEVDDHDAGLPEVFALKQNYPNPFNPATNILFELATASRVTLSVYNVLGQTVKVLVDGSLPAGSHEAHWDGRDRLGREAASGVYFYKLDADSFSDVKKMLLLR